MIIKIWEDGTIKWCFFRKSYRKARWRKVGQRKINDFMEFRNKYPHAHGWLIIRAI